MRKKVPFLKDDPEWFKDAIIYELHVRAFADSNGDGIGDFRGLIDRLDYLQDLGVTAVWLLPFYPSPLRDDGYDISDYFSINPSYGTMKDFREFLRQAHKRHIRVITELVVNHTSEQHEWFQRSRRAKPGTYWRDFYVWSDDPNKYKGTRIIFKDFESSNWSYDPVAKSYYWHRFYSHQPDLNYENPEVQKNIFKVVDYWFAMGVDGMRLDAIPYLYEEEGTSCENLPQTHAFLKKLRAHIDKKFANRMILGEANQWPEDSVDYFGDGDECHMNFHFPLMPRLFMALRMEDRYSIIDIIKQTPEIPENSQWAVFLRNHDEMTLEMVTDEERDYMYNVYASDPRARINLGIRRRLAPLLGNDRRQIELLNGLLFSMVGTPVLYYGDEIGMGDNIYLGDRDSVRTPFQWSPDRNAGFSKTNPQSLFLPVIIAPEYHYETVNVENQQNNPNSLLWWMKKLITLRKQYPAFQRGTLEFLYPENFKVLAFIREYEGQKLLVIANLSRNVQSVELDLSKFEGRIPREIFGQSDFPQIGQLPYFLTLSPHAFYWFELRPEEAQAGSRWLLREPKPIRVPQEPLQALKETDVRRHIEQDIPAYLQKMRWFAGKANTPVGCEIEDVIYAPFTGRNTQSALLIVRVNYLDKRDSDIYLIALAYADGERAERIKTEHPDVVISEFVQSNKKDYRGIYYDAMIDANFGSELLKALLRRKSFAGEQGEIQADVPRPVKKEWLKDLPTPRTLGAEQSNSSLLFGNRFFLKVFRKLEEGENPDIEIGRFLAARKFEYTAPLIGNLRYSARRKQYSLAILQEFVESQQDAWSLMVDQLSRYIEEVLVKSEDQMPAVPEETFFDLAIQDTPDNVKDLMGYNLSLSHLLGQRTGEMHRCLSSEEEEKSFRPDDFTPFDQRSLYQSMRNLAEKATSQLRARLKHLPEEKQDLGEHVLKQQASIISKFSFVKDTPIHSQQTRIHGDYHLGQVLYTGKDFIIIDFEGEPARSLGERRLKRSPLKDVAGLLRSFDYVAHYHLKQKYISESDRQKLQPWLELWRRWMGAEFLRGYQEAVRGSRLLPADMKVTQKFTEVLVLEKALYELGYELGSRPDWVEIPLKGILEVLGEMSRGVSTEE